MKRFIKLFIVILLFLSIISVGYKISEPNINSSNKVSNEIIQNSISTSNLSNNEPIFTSMEIPDSIYEKMLGKSIPMKDKDKVDLSSLKYLQISYFGFDGKSHVRRNDCKFKACR